MSTTPQPMEARVEALRTYSRPVEIPSGANSAELNIGRRNAHLTNLQKVKTEDFRIDNVPERLNRLGDLWKPLLEKHGRLSLDRLMA